MKSEFLKIRYHKWIPAVSMMIPLFAAVMTGLLRVPGVSGKELIQTKILQSLYLAQNWLIVIAALYFGEDYKGGTLRTDLLCTPSRIRLFMTKLGCLLGWITIVLIITVTVFAGQLLWHAGLAGFDAAFLQLLALGCLSAAELAFLAAALTMLFQSGTLSMAVMISLLMGVGHILLQFGSKMNCLPGVASMNAFYLTEMQGFLPCNRGLMIQALWGLAALLSAGCFFRYRAVR